MTIQPANEPETRDLDLGRKIEILPYDPVWQNVFEHQREKIEGALGGVALNVEHVGSTSVPGLAAKPVIDIHLTVLDSANEATYAGSLENAGYVLMHRSPAWFEHRLLKKLDPEVNLHVFSQGCPELGRCLLFRDWLRTSRSDRTLYAATKSQLALKTWGHVQDYADAKRDVIAEIMSRAEAWSASRRRT
jgi:GrpB-like predicted nucleotidyltransferase (UPF0157 family)